MANLTADKKSVRKDGTVFTHPAAASTVIYVGALVAVNANGYAVPAADDATQRFLGKADRRADNSSGANGAIFAEGHREGVFEFDGPGFTPADTGVDLYVIDDHTVGRGVVAQPVNTTGVTLSRLPNSRGGSYQLAYTSATTTLTYGGGSGVNVGAGGVFTLTAPDGSQILATVAAASLPGADKTDSIQLRHLRCGSLAEVINSSLVFVDILGAVRR